MTNIRPLTLSRENIANLHKDGKFVLTKMVALRPGFNYEWVGWASDTTGRKSNIGKAAWNPIGALFNEIIYILPPWGRTGQRFWVRRVYTYHGQKKTLPKDDAPDIVELALCSVENKNGVWQFVGGFVQVYQ